MLTRAARFAIAAHRGRHSPTPEADPDALYRAIEISRRVHRYAMLCANECRKRFGLSEDATRRLFESMLPQSSVANVFARCESCWHAVDRRQTRASTDGSHRHVIDLYLDGKPGARCLCVDCWQSWPEGGMDGTFPTTCRADRSLPSLVVLAFDPSRSNPKQNLTDLNAEVAR